MANASGKLQPIYIRRVRKSHAAEHHGGGWKIAYADFVTAMMAFFLLMWLLGSTAQGDLQGIAEYFQSPLKVALAGGSGAGDSNNIIKGGGASLTETKGNVKRADIETTERRRLETLKAELEAADAARMRRVQAQLERAMQTNPVLSGMRKQTRMDATADGLRIQIVDDQGRPMFDAGSTRVNPYMRELLHNIARLVDEADGRVVLSGHTDASPYSGGERGYSNWELSADRANASRRELLAGGLREDRVVRVLGLGSSVPYVPQDPLSPLNRRISVLVLGQVGLARWQGGSEVPVSETQALERLLSQRQVPPAAAPASSPQQPPTPGATQ